MLLVISQNKDSTENLVRLIKSSPIPIFAYFRTAESVEDDFSIPPRAIIINECGDAIKSAKICENIRKEIPNASLGVILNEAHAKASLFRYVKNADCELISPFSDEKVVEFLQKLGVDNNVNRFSPTITCSSKASTLLGYDLGLSRGENRILMFLIAFNEHICPVNLIKEACLLSNTASISSVRVLIDRINKKAKDISGRPLILSHYGKGYSINQNP